METLRLRHVRTRRQILLAVQMRGTSRNCQLADDSVHLLGLLLGYWHCSLVFVMYAAGAMAKSNLACSTKLVMLTLLNPLAQPCTCQVRIRKDCLLGVGGSKGVRAKTMQCL
eukprot:1474833-Amphidinium_carterae.1